MPSDVYMDHLRGQQMQQRIQQQAQLQAQQRALQLYQQAVAHAQQNEYFQQALAKQEHRQWQRQEEQAQQQLRELSEHQQLLNASAARRRTIKARPSRERYKAVKGSDTSAASTAGYASAALVQPSGTAAADGVGAAATEPTQMSSVPPLRPLQVPATARLIAPGPSAAAGSTVSAFAPSGVMAAAGGGDWQMAMPPSMALLPGSGTLAVPADPFATAAGGQVATGPRYYPGATPYPFLAPAGEAPFFGGHMPGGALYALPAPAAAAAYPMSAASEALRAPPVAGPASASVSRFTSSSALTAEGSAPTRAVTHVYIALAIHQFALAAGHRYIVPGMDHGAP